MIVRTMESLRKRLAWEKARVVLRMAGVTPGLGWARTIDRSAASEIHDGKLQDLLIESILCGEKHTKLYSLEDGVRDAMHRWMQALPLSDCKSAAIFPQLLDDVDLAEEAADFKLLSICSNDDGMGLVFSSIFQMKVREEIDFERFENAAEMRSQFDEVIGLKYRRVQLHHVIWVPHFRQQIEVRVDAPRGMPEEAIHAHHSKLKAIVTDGGVLALGAPHNLFPAVRAFYDDDTDGEVSEITFSTTTSAIKHEKMIRRRSLRLDQRQEAYHRGGKKELKTDIRIYRISVEWPKVEDQLHFAPTLTLSASGPSGRAGAADPIISGAFVGNCVRAADYEFVIERLGVKSGLFV